MGRGGGGGLVGMLDVKGRGSRAQEGDWKDLLHHPLHLLVCQASLRLHLQAPLHARPSVGVGARQGGGYRWDPQAERPLPDCLFLLLRAFFLTPLFFSCSH